MKKSLLPLSERFTMHAAALLNKVHNQPKPAPASRNRQHDTARNKRFIFGTMDFNNIQYFTKPHPPA